MARRLGEREAVLPGLGWPVQLDLAPDWPVRIRPERTLPGKVSAKAAQQTISSLQTILTALPKTAELMDAIGQHWATALRRRYPAHPAKMIARAYAAVGRTVSVKTVETWLGGQAPRTDHLAVAIHLHGEAMAAEVLAPGSGWFEAARLRETLTAVRARLDQLAGVLEP